jgi:hypothetical protein
MRLTTPSEAKMDTFESSTSSFIVKVWLEDPDDTNDSPFWRGHITHVPSNERVYVQNLEDISRFIASYLRGMGLEADQISQGVEEWLKGRGV